MLGGKILLYSVCPFDNYHSPFLVAIFFVAKIQNLLIPGDSVKIKVKEGHAAGIFTDEHKGRTFHR